MMNVDSAEVSRFEDLASRWWDPEGDLKPLHQINPLRLEYIDQRFPLDGQHVLDLGCGGGLLCEPLNRLGATITGIDASNDNIEVAKLHSKEMNLNIEYIHAAPENLDLKNNACDALLCMEVVEHLRDVNLFIENCSKLIKKNGIMFVATINKNLKSYIFAILGAEYVLRWLPIGTHDWDKFLTPQDLEIVASKNNFLANEIVGMKFNLLSKKWFKSNDTSVNYISTFLKD